MTREQLKALLPSGYTETNVSKLLDAIHAEITPYRDAAAAAESKHGEAQAALDELQRKYDTDMAAAEAKAKSAGFDAMLKGVLQEKKARIPDSVRALLDLDTLRAAEDPEKAAREAVDAIAADAKSAFLFETDKPIQRYVNIGAPTGNGSSTGISEAERQLRAGAGVMKKE